MLSQSLWKIYSESSGLPAFWDLLDRHNTLNPQEAKSEMGRLLQRQVRYFARRSDSLPEWKEAAAIDDLDEFMRVWEQLPVLTRSDLNSHFPAREIADRFHLRGKVSSTGGSTGEPTHYFHDSNMLKATSATRMYSRIQAGWKAGLPTIAVWGSERDVGKASTLRNRISSRLRNEYLVAGYSLSAKTTDQVIRHIGKHKHVALYGFTSMLEFIAKDIVQRGINVPAGKVVAAWNGGEMLHPEQAKIFQLAFGIPLLNFYGSRELSAMAYQPRSCSYLKPLRPLLYLEILNSKGKTASYGEPGRLIWTSTVCQGTPFLRYDCGDIASFDRPDVDESGIRRITNIHGRSAGLMHLNGKLISGLFWNHLFKDYPEVEQFQVVLRSDTAIEVRIKGKPMSCNGEATMRSVLKGMAGDTNINLKWVAHIERSRQGKLEQVIREPLAHS